MCSIRLFALFTPNVGIVSRSVLLHLLQKRMFGDLHQQMRYNPTVDDFQGPSQFFICLISFSPFDILHAEAYPRQPSLQRVLAGLEDDDMNRQIDITPYMNSYPYTLDRDASLSRVFRLFRTMGLRHIVVGT